MAAALQLGHRAAGLGCRGSCISARSCSGAGPAWRLHFSRDVVLGAGLAPWLLLYSSCTGSGLPRQLHCSWIIVQMGRVAVAAALQLVHRVLGLGCRGSCMTAGQPSMDNALNQSSTAWAFAKVGTALGLLFATWMGFPFWLLWLGWGAYRGSCSLDRIQ